MPSKPKAPEIAAEAKKVYIPYIKQKYPQWDTTSYLIADSALQMRCSPSSPPLRCRIAMIEGDPVDVALSWATTNEREGEIPVISMANDKKPGGDWESNVMAPEENLCRRSNLVATLNDAKGHHSNNYPIPPRGGIYSQHVVVFRCGPEQYKLWKDFKALPVISVPPVRRPKLDVTNTKYSFEDEKELMKDKIRTALRIAVYYDHPDICFGAYGCGPIFKNPTREVATMFKDILFFEDEFKGQFSNVVFAFESGGSASSSISGSSSGSGSNSSASQKSDMQIFKEVFDPAKLFNTAYNNFIIYSLELYMSNAETI